MSTGDGVARDLALGEAVETAPQLGKLRAVLWGGLTAGVLDILYASVATAVRGRSPFRMLQSIASGVLGQASFEGGSATATLGLGLHFVIAFGAATVFFFASRKLRVLVRHAIPSGLAFGVAVYFFMQQVVLPLSAVQRPAQAPPLSLVLINIAVHMLLVGLPIALFTRRAEVAGVTTRSR